MQNIVIFGTGAAGRAIYRALKDEFNIVAFIDNNPNKQGTKYCDIEIYSVQNVVNLKFDYVYLGGIWADEMEAQLLNLIDKSKIKVLDEKDISFSTPSRQVATDEIMRVLDGYFKEIKMDYFLCNSALISLLRGNSLSVVSDVDLYVMNYADLEYLARELPHFLGSEYKLNLRYVEGDAAVRTDGQIKRICITNNLSESIVIDIGLFDEYENFMVCDYDDGRFFYFPKEIFEGGFTKLEYMGFELNVLKHYNEYLEFMYGKNYLEMPKRFSSNDYLNLKTKAQLEELKA
ncbi:nucleoside-diphosphate sugar epimerase/dehydratase [Campylobacter sp.]